MNDLNSMDRVLRAVRAQIELQSLKPENCSYGTYTVLKIQADRLRDALTDAEKAEAMVLCKYKSLIKV